MEFDIFEMSKVEKIAIFARKKTFFPVDLLIWFAEQNFSEMSPTFINFKNFWGLSYGRGKIFEKTNFSILFSKKLENFFFKNFAPSV